MALTSAPMTFALASKIQALALALRAALTVFQHHPQSQEINNTLLVINNKGVSLQKQSKLIILY